RPAMPSLLDYRRRIRAVKNTQQITKAMKMIAASRLRKAQERMVGARPFSKQIVRMLHDLATVVDEEMHPLLATRDLSAPGARVLMIVVTTDKGLCGGFNTNLIKAASNRMLEHPTRHHTMALIGRKGRDFYRRRGMPVTFELSGIFSHLKYSHAQEIARVAMEEFTSGRIDGVDLSPPMLEQARRRGLYTALDAADLSEHLRRTPLRYDAVAAADVFIYVGALEPVFAGVARVLAPQGLFAFSVERADEADDFVLRPSLRYAHGERGLRALAGRHGFDVLAVEPGTIREDQRRPIDGLYLLLRKR
ncbi:MAG: F0F1 ATP synthase subunit gamma, partial [Burkholderiales bacterium]|nr:F0F1 ATP synthase subunit gamma [Burkholderiales bacterium]